MVATVFEVLAERGFQMVARLLLRCSLVVAMVFEVLAELVFQMVARLLLGGC